MAILRISQNDTETRQPSYRLLRPSDTPTSETAAATHALPFNGQKEMGRERPVTPSPQVPS
jgi:hypothetical protein